MNNALRKTLWWAQEILLSPLFIFVMLCVMLLYFADMTFEGK